MKTTTQKPPTHVFMPSERFPLAGRKKPLARSTKPAAYEREPWDVALQVIADDLNYLEIDRGALQVGDIIRATYYTTGIVVPPNHINLSGGWGKNTYLFDIGRIEPGRYGHRSTHVISAMYWKPGRRANQKAGVFLLLEPRYELIVSAEELEPGAVAIVSARATMMPAMRALPNPDTRAELNEVIDGEYEEDGE